MAEQLSVTSTTGVDLSLKIAGVGARSYAFVLDWHIRFLVALSWFSSALWILYGAFSVPDNAGTNFALVVLLPSAIIYFLYHPILEVVMRGRTPGKRIAGVRIVTLDAQEPSILAHFLRNVLRILDSAPLAYMIGLTVAFVSKTSSRIGDMAAGTVLVYEQDEKLTASTYNISDNAVAKYGLANMEMVAELLERWDVLGADHRIRLATKMLDRLQHPYNSTDELKPILTALLNSE